MGFVDTGNTQSNTGQKIEFYHITTDQTVEFKAFLTEFNDQFTSNWESEEVYGRMDPIKTFKNTSREIALGFDIVAGSVDEAKGNLSKISTLIISIVLVGRSYHLWPLIKSAVAETV